MRVNYNPAIRSNADAEALLRSYAVKTYIVWRVPFEEDQYRLSYVMEEGPFDAPRHVVKCVLSPPLPYFVDTALETRAFCCFIYQSRVFRHMDVSYLPENGSYFIVSQINPTMYNTMADLLKQRAYVDLNSTVEGCQSFPEAEKTAVQLSMNPVDASEALAARMRKRVSSTTAALSRAADAEAKSNKKKSFSRKLFAFLRKVTPKPVQKLVWLWDSIPPRVLVAFGLAVLAVQLTLVMWTFIIRSGACARQLRAFRAFPAS